MSLLSALVRAYDRLPDAPPYGFSSEKICFCVILNPDGTVPQSRKPPPSPIRLR